MTHDVKRTSSGPEDNDVWSREVGKDIVVFSGYIGKDPHVNLWAAERYMGIIQAIVDGKSMGRKGSSHMLTEAEVDDLIAALQEAKEHIHDRRVAS